LKVTIKMMTKTVKRIITWIMIVLAGVLIDEYLKEGYLFNPNDLIKIATHENIVLILLLILVGIILYARRQQ
jgi:Ni,Fe-hydrogenase I cytochrome b subunit